MLSRGLVVVFLFAVVLGIWLGQGDNIKYFNNFRESVDQNQVIENIASGDIATTSVLEQLSEGLNLATATASTTIEATTTPVKFSNYIEIVNSCGPHFDGSGCVNLRSGPGTTFPTALALRNGVVLKTSGSIEGDGRLWYKVAFDEWIRYPDRLGKDLYVAADFVKVIPVAQDLTPNSTSTNKRIIVDRSEQMLYAYEGDNLFMKEKVSTGLPDMPTPRGSFKVFSKLPSRYMQGPLPGISDQEYDLPGVPWTMYFTAEGAAIHGAYWHNNFGKVWSHGCVNLPIEKAEELYKWAPIGTRVIVQD